MMPGGHVLILGLGNLGRRLVLALAARPELSVVVACGRDAAAAAAFARLASACTGAAVRSRSCDALDADALAGLLVEEWPHVVVQCASLLSPWLVPGRPDTRAEALRVGGFALQLAAQLPIPMALMRAARAARFDGPVVNCSYPDVTHPVLARMGLAPTVGIGNAGMIAAITAARLREGGGTAPLVRVAAHHAHVASVVKAELAAAGDASHPRVWLGEKGRRGDASAFRGGPLPDGRELNALSTAHAVDVVVGLLPGAAARRTSAPGPRGLPGGWPVRLGGGRVELDLPPGVTEADVARFHEDAAKLDGVERIDLDGTVHFTDRARHAVEAAPELAEPLHPDGALRRFGALDWFLSARA